MLGVIFVYMEAELYHHIPVDLVCRYLNSRFPGLAIGKISLSDKVQRGQPSEKQGRCPENRVLVYAVP
jgi:hypothetical protein